MPPLKNGGFGTVASLLTLKPKEGLVARLWLQVPPHYNYEVDKICHLQPSTMDYSLVSNYMLTKIITVIHSVMHVKMLYYLLILVANEIK